ncbi:MAG: TrbC/VirB2 family protein [Candidatus Staskawiczbacteria bacterium]|jgi:hypothetical protein
MNKKIAYILSSSILFFTAFPALAQSIPNYLNTSSFCTLLSNIATGVGDGIAALGTTMIIVAAVYYLTSSGSPEMIGRAKKALIYAIAGIAVGLAANAIVNIVKNIIGASGGNC